MSGLRFDFEWQDADGVQGPELACTWARFEAYLDGVLVTEFQDLRSRTVRKGPFVPLYPIAEWLASNWWSLWFEDRARLTRDPLERHALTAAREGFALPDLRLWPEDGDLIVEVQPSEQRHCEARFLNTKTARVRGAGARKEVARFIEAVLEKLRAAGIRGTPLESEWQLIGRTQADPAEGAFCEFAARLGLDPYAVPDLDAQAIEQARSELPPDVARDFFDAVRPDHVLKDALSLQGVLQKVRQVHRTGDLAQWRRRHPEPAPSPHEQGYRDARDLREALQLNGTRFESVQDVAARLGLSLPQDLEAVPFDAVIGLSASDTPVFLVRSPLQPSRLFAYCRAIGEALRSREPAPVILTRGRSLRQKRSRAFAAEFLAPAALIRADLSTNAHGAETARALVGDEECEELGKRFGVSPMVIRHQIEDHGIAQYAGASYTG